jgi:RNA polymerase sigma-70 factor, ECF subfamily
MSDSPTHDAFLKDLAARLARGEEAAFAELYDACVGQLYGYLVARLGSHDAAGDVLQSAFLRAVKSRRRFRGVENPVAYLFQIARNEAARAMGRRRIVTHSLPAAEPYANTNDNSDDAEAVAAALNRLEADDRELVELKIFAGLTFREIAAIVDRPPATVATRYRRALESLRDWLTRQYR